MREKREFTQAIATSKDATDHDIGYCVSELMKSRAETMSKLNLKRPMGKTVCKISIKE